MAEGDADNTGSGEREATGATLSRVSLRRWAQAVLCAAGAAPRAAEITAGCLVDAAQRGLDSHGPALLELYLPSLAAGTISGDAEPEVVVDMPAVAVIDGHHGLGAYVSVFAMQLCCDKAEKVGAAVVGVRNSTHFGAASCYAEIAARRGCIGIAVSNSDPGMAPLGALHPILGTNPLAIAVPAGRNPWLPSLDMATSTVAHGKIRLAAREGLPIPGDWAIGENGAHTTDPAEALAGAMLPMAGHKGWGLAFMIDVLAGCLTGGRVSPEIQDMSGPHPQEVGHLFIAIQVSSFTSEVKYSASLANLIEAIHNASRADGIHTFMVPGEPEARSAARRAEDVSLIKETASCLRRLGERYSVPFGTGDLA